jgi:hypothetical protein
MWRFALIVPAILVMHSAASANIIFNGDFEQGNVGFTSAATYSPGNIVNVLTYDVVKNPALDHNQAASYGDHTTGSGLMLAINGPTTGPAIAWGQTLTVKPNTQYTFTAWYSSWTPTNPALLNFEFNGTSVGSATAPTTTGVWQQFTATWNSGSATSLTLNIVDQTTAYMGNDFALDDISLNGPAPQATPEPTTFALASFGAGGLLLSAWRKKKLRRQTESAQ